MERTILRDYSFKEKWKVITDPSKYDENCCINPEGDWYNVSYTRHEEFAHDYIKEFFPKLYNKDGWKTRHLDILVDKLGWISIESSIFLGTIVRGSDTMTYAQYTALYGVFGNTLLFRGWTIQKMWEKSKHYDG